MSSALDTFRAGHSTDQNRADAVAAVKNDRPSTSTVLHVNSQVVRAVCRALLSGVFETMPPKTAWAFELCRTSRPEYIVNHDKSLSVCIAGRVPCRIPEAAYGTPAMAAEWATRECLKWKKA